MQHALYLQNLHFGGSGPALITHGLLDQTKPEIQIQMQHALG
jgi:hypothetical protein